VERKSDAGRRGKIAGPQRNCGGRGGGKRILHVKHMKPCNAGALRKQKEPAQIGTEEKVGLNCPRRPLKGPQHEKGGDRKLGSTMGSEKHPVVRRNTKKKKRGEKGACERSDPQPLKERRPEKGTCKKRFHPRLEGFR